MTDEIYINNIIKNLCHCMMFTLFTYIHMHECVSVTDQFFLLITSVHGMSYNQIRTGTGDTSKVYTCIPGPCMLRFTRLPAGTAYAYVKPT